MILNALHADPIDIERIRQSATCLFDNKAVDAAIVRMAEKITRDLAGSDPLLLCVMNGGLILTGRLAPLLDFPLQIDYLHATRYRDEVRGGELNWLSYPRERLAGRPVIVVDDILDEGNTLKAVCDYALEQGATRAYGAVLVEKLHQRRIDGVRAECIGLQIEDKFVFGFGLDYKGYLRNAPGIFAVADAELE
jgi:hypoxanthine phosphoribosyltransferase